MDLHFESDFRFRSCEIPRHMRARDTPSSTTTTLLVAIMSSKLWIIKYISNSLFSRPSFIKDVKSLFNMHSNRVPEQNDTVTRPVSSFILYLFHRKNLGFECCHFQSHSLGGRRHSYSNQSPGNASDGYAPHGNTPDGWYASNGNAPHGYAPDGWYAPHG